MLYLLDANVMIRAHEDYYPIDRIPQFWAWFAGLGTNGTVKVPYEICREIAVSTGPLHDWLTDAAISQAMSLDMRPARDWYMEPVGAVAIAAEGRETLAMLRRKDEPFRQLLLCLDMAIASATIDDVYIDEVNTPQN